MTNAATASATAPDGTTVPSAVARASTTTGTTASLSLDKSASAPVDVNGDGRVDAGDTITYTFVIRSTGVRTVSQVSLSDPRVGGAVACPTATLAGRARTTCTATYAITQADVDAGAVTNTATVTGRDPAGAAITPATDSTTTPTSALSALALDKTAGTPVDANGDGRLDAGDRIPFSFLVTNTGARTVTGLVVRDPLLTAAPACPSTALLPGASTTCGATYVVTQADVDAGAVTNTATVTGTAPDGTPVTSEPDSTTTATSTLSALVLDKTADTPVDVNTRRPGRRR